MKAQKKDIKAEVEKKFGLKLTLNEELYKYTGQEFASPKLKIAQEKFKNGIKFKQVAL